MNNENQLLKESIESNLNEAPSVLESNGKEVRSIEDENRKDEKTMQDKAGNYIFTSEDSNFEMPETISKHNIIPSTFSFSETESLNDDIGAESLSGSYSFSEEVPLEEEELEIKKVLYPKKESTYDKLIPYESTTYEIYTANFTKPIEDNKDPINLNFKNANSKYETIVNGMKVVSDVPRLHKFLKELCRENIQDENLSSLIMEINKNASVFNSNEYVVDNLKYRTCNYLTNYDYIKDGFFDIGPNNKNFSTILEYFINYNPTNKEGDILREVIYIDASNDPTLSVILDRAAKIQPNKLIYMNLVSLINDFLGTDNEDKKFNRFLVSHQKQKGTNLLKIGEVKNGLDRHKSLLFKYLCDKLNLKCSIVRKTSYNNNNLFVDKHVFNLILINGVISVVDFKYHPNKIVKPSKESSMFYYETSKFIL